MAGRTIYDSVMNISCTVQADFDGFTGAMTLILMVRRGLLVGGGQVTIFERIGSLGWGQGLVREDHRRLPIMTGMPLEIGIDGEYYSVFEPDGTVLWSRPVTDESSHATGSVVFDFEDDAYPSCLCR